MIPQWLYLSQRYGNSGTTVITVSAGTNLELFQRLKVLNIETDNTELNGIVAINQGIQKSNFIELTPDYIVAPNNGGSFTVDISSDKQWTVSYPNWVSGPVTGNGIQTITIVMDSTSADSRTGEIVFTTNTNRTATLTIVQSDNEYYPTKYLTFEVISGSSITFRTSSRIENYNIRYSKDNGNNWTMINSEDGSISVSPGDIVIVKGLNDHYSDGTFYTRFSGTFNVYGNIMSLVYGDNFLNKQFDKTTNYQKHCFKQLFSGSSVCDASHLILPNNVTQGCYEGMFYDCKKLTKAPKLPATELDFTCYREMFRSCTSLIEAPDLPASAFTWTSSQEYAYMFYNCTSLHYIKCLMKQIDTTSTSGWLYNVASLGEFTKATGVNWPSGADGIPTGWIVYEE